MENLQQKTEQIIANITENDEMKDIFLKYVLLKDDAEKKLFWGDLSAKISSKKPLEQQIFMKNLQKGLLAISNRMAVLAENILEPVK
jgi:beta-lactamase class D